MNIVCNTTTYFLHSLVVLDDGHTLFRNLAKYDKYCIVYSYTHCTQTAICVYTI